MASATNEVAQGSGIDYLIQHVERVVKHCDDEIGRRNEEINEYETLKKRLEDMPKKLSYEIMVPFGKVGYMPGRLINTNKVSVLLGDNVFAEVSCYHACNLIDRRISFIRKTIKDFESQKKLAKSRVEFGNQLFKEDAAGIEIKEPFDEETEKVWREERQHKKPAYDGKPKKVSQNEFEKLMQRLDELEREECEELEDEDEEEREEEEEEGDEGNGEVLETKSLREEASSDVIRAVKELVAQKCTSKIARGGGESSEESELDSDDLPSPSSSPPRDGPLTSKVTKEDSVKKPERTVRFNDVLSCRTIPSRFSEAESHTGGSALTKIEEVMHEDKSPHQNVRRSILRNSDKTSPVDNEAVAAMDVLTQPRLVPSSEKAFTGVIKEREFAPLASDPGDHALEETNEPPRRVSRFKQLRLKSAI